METKKIQYVYYVYGENFYHVLYKQKYISWYYLQQYMKKKFNINVFLAHYYSSLCDTNEMGKKEVICRDFHVYHSEYSFAIIPLSKYVSLKYGNLERKLCCYGKREKYILYIYNYRHNDLHIKNIPVAIFRKIPRKFPKELVNFNIDDYIDQHVLANYLTV